MIGQPQRPAKRDSHADAEAFAPPARDAAVPRRRFPRGSKLLRHGDFQRVYEHGQRQFMPHMTVFFLRRETPDGPRVGVTVGRALGQAVQRNRIKRRLRESVRRHLSILDVSVDVVINPKKSVVTLKFDQLSEEMARAFTSVRKTLSRA